jgi:light-regulated signal transduction histidine kinase (bacteriophytochrome)
VRVQQLDRSNRELQQFAYVASHDLQEPLRKIMSFGERLTRKYEALLTGEGKEYITRMNNAAQRMETLINDLLTFSRSTQTDRSFEPTDLNSIFAHVLADMDTVERTKAQINLPDNFPVIESIPSQMRQLFQNLLNNALKFAHSDRPPQVDVYCRLSAGTDLPENYALLPEKDYCIIDIKDNGIGFEQSNAERIFTIFQRLHGRSEYSGSGVGLAICKKIVDNHQGAIFAEGLEGKGAAFTVVLPLSQGN